MTMIAVDERMLIHSFDYFPYIGEDKYHQPEYGPKQVISKTRVDVSSYYRKNIREKTVDLYAVIFCYAGLTSPLPKFIEQSKVVFDSMNLTIERVIPLYQPFSAELFGYELEVV